ncbi:MAG: M20/M25/M40 family metallo-hydrolase, partial [Chlamydiae bacterium]|nr:M20/M25/M40 family metallo-hydrolase [Chlamydiota bacterium]
MAVSSSHQITDSVLHTAITQLREFVEIRSVSNPNSSDYSKDNLQEAANFSSSLLQELGFDIRQVTVDDSPPFVLAEKIVDAAKPTILFYAHFDVQPVSREKWETDPFILTELDERLYGRGASDDKGGIIAIITALGIHQREYGALPCNVKIL